MGSRLECRCELQGNWFSFSCSAALCVKLSVPKLTSCAKMDTGTNKKHEMCHNMWALVKFYCSRGKTSTKMFKKMKSVYSDDSLNRTPVFALHEEFKGEKPLSCAIADVVDDYQHYLSKLINCENVNWRASFFNLLRDGSHNRLLKVDDQEYYEKIQYAAHGSHT